MAVYFYDVGDHLAGFVGYRAITSVGTNSDIRQRYFSLNDYSHTRAEELATQLDEKWKQEAKELKKKLVLGTSPQQPTTVCKGLFTQIVIERKRRGGAVKCYYICC
ncbi:hypothetical protein J4N45_10820 [Vibrio sp. SCSIO 43140]|uniref:hypothetical protein n=1 Tax=Vibrio sp. SCSIO 43140 TaxID=2819100 RepID=UPI002075FF73|nr:hypothetical protein [Vibrio sp. SCSIO 43140]USD59022.1 hypothetical protein J4N45_10820 [Vibrio sp. SCSIO 43140]